MSALDSIFGCLHRWKITAYTPVDVYSGFGGDRPISHKTDISMLCEKCGLPRVRTLRGNWAPRGDAR